MDGDPILFENATILTMDLDLPVVEAMLVESGRIAAVGDREELRARSRGARRVDLGGQTVVPGFNDSHCHILSFGLDLERLDVSADVVNSIEDIERLVTQRAAGAPPDAWILGRGYDQNQLRERRHPNRDDLDRAAGGHPVALWHTSGHVLAANSRALELAGITSEVITPSGGEIERDPHGAPTGVLKEAPAMNLVDRSIPTSTIEGGADAIIRAMRAMAEEGITSASDAATGRGDTIDDELQMYRRAAASGDLAARITLMPEILHVAPPDSAVIRSSDEFDAGDRSTWLRVGPTKIFSDGALSTRTAALRTPYLGTDSRGILIWSPEILNDMVARANAAGWQIATHALGDRAIDVVLDAYEYALQHTPRLDHRHRIEHCMVAHEDQVERIRRLGVFPSLQPDIFRLGDGYISALGMDAASEVIPMALFNRLGVRVAFSSDRPVIPGHPLQCIFDAMVRTTPAGVTLGAHHTISAETAILHYTVGGAYATHTEHQQGTLLPGHFADFAVLSENPLTVPPQEFGRVGVTMTVVDGRIVAGG